MARASTGSSLNRSRRRLALTSRSSGAGVPFSTTKIALTDASRDFILRQNLSATFMENKRSPIERVSLTIPRDTLGQLDAMIVARGFASRSQAVNELINRELVDYSRQS